MCPAETIYPQLNYLCFNHSQMMITHGLYVEKHHNYGKTNTLYNAKHPMNDGTFDNNFYSYI